jgi:hypothetical protein
MGIGALLASVLALLAGSGAAPAAGATGSGWFLPPLPRQAVVDGGSLGTSGDPVACVTGTTQCIAAVSTASHRGARLVLAGPDPVLWEARPLPARFGTTTALACAARTDCLAAGTSATGAPVLARSADGGLSWHDVRAASLGGSFVPTGISCPSATTCWLVGHSVSDAGAVLALTRDGGSSWRLVSSRLGAAAADNLDAISCPSLRRCVAVGAGASGGGAVVLSTSNGGVSWTASSSPALVEMAPLASVSCARGTSFCVAAGALVSGTPVLAISRDAGTSWIGDVVPADDRALSGVSCASRAVCWAAGAGQLTLIGTADGGSIWQPQFFAAPTDVTGPGQIACPLIQVCVATTSSGVLVTTTNGNITASNGPTAVETGKVPAGSVAPVVASPSTPGVSIDPAEAKQVATSLWAARTVARHDRDATALAIVESGPALAVDAGECDSVCQPPAVAPPTGLSVAVPRQSGWPASFVAIASYTDGCDATASPCNDLFVATQPHPGAPFTIAFDASDSAIPPEILTDGNGDGYALPTPAVSNTGAILADFATTLESIKTSDYLPPGVSIDPNPFTASYQEQNYLSAAKASALGFTYSSSYNPDPGPTYVFETNEGTLQCGTVDYQETNTPLAGLVLVQTIDRSTWPSIVPPGSYSRIETQGAYMACFVPSPQTGGHVIVVLDRHGVIGSAGTQR